MLGALTVALRLPALFSERHLTFDDGVFGASAVAMREGGAPFSEVFSSQGPLFLPLVRLFDLAGLQTLNGPRLLGIASALVLVGAIYVAARGYGDRAAGLIGALLVTTSGSILWTTGPIAADGPALAAATVAIAAALAYSRRPTWGLTFTIGLAMGAALSVKATAAPALVVVAWVLLAGALERGVRVDRDGAVRLLVSAGCALVVWLLPSLWFGLSDVWDQSVVYHQEAAGGRDVWANLRKIASTSFDRDLPILVFTVLSGVSVAIRGVPFPKVRRTWPAPRPSTLLWAWLGISFALLLYIHPLWRPHLSGLIPPAVLLIAAYRPRARDALIAGILLIPLQAWRMADYLNPDSYHERTEALVQELDSLPDGAWVISDDPGQIWRVARRTPDDLVDTSILRIESGRITAESLAEAAADERVCAVVVWSSVRFGSFDELPDLLEEAGYDPVATFDDHRVLYVKDDCRAP